MSSIPLRIVDPADLDDEVTVAQLQRRLEQQEFRALKRWYRLMSNNFASTRNPKAKRHLKWTEVRSSRVKRRMKRAQARNLDAQQELRAVRAESTTERG